MPDRKTPPSQAKRNVASLLKEQLEQLLGDSCKAILKREKPWASITFSGTRHYFEIGVNIKAGNEQAAKLIDSLPDHEFDLPGHFVADLLIREQDAKIQKIPVEILTIIDPVTAKD